jgi:hypothetical protein
VTTPKTSTLWMGGSCDAMPTIGIAFMIVTARRGSSSSTAAAGVARRIGGARRHSKKLGSGSSVGWG